MARVREYALVVLWVFLGFLAGFTVGLAWEKAPACPSAPTPVEKVEAAPEQGTTLGDLVANTMRVTGCTPAYLWEADHDSPGEAAFVVFECKGYKHKGAKFAALYIRPSDSQSWVIVRKWWAERTPGQKL